VPDENGSGSQLQQWIATGTTVLAPVTVLGAVLFYFGYVSARAEYTYFGVDVDTLGLSTQDYVMRSPQSLLVPLLSLTTAGAAFMVLHAHVKQRIALAIPEACEDAPDADAELNLAGRVVAIRRMLRTTTVAGLAVLVAGIVLLFAYPYLRTWGYYALVTPLVIALGAALVAYSAHLRHFMQHRQQQASSRTQETRTPAAALKSADPTLLPRRLAIVLMYVLVTASLFWATATVAQWSGRGLAQYQALHLDSLPAVILDSEQQLSLTDPGVTESILSKATDQTFRYRYRGLYLLIEGHDRMFLVPGQWSAHDSTLMVPLDGAFRIQFRFENEAP
jgi:hypothetical protein